MHGNTKLKFIIKHLKPTDNYMLTYTCHLLQRQAALDSRFTHISYLNCKNQQDALFYYQFISIIINLYMFRAGLLIIIRR